MNVSVVLNAEVIVGAGVVVEVTVDHRSEEEVADHLDLAGGQEVDQGRFH